MEWTNNIEDERVAFMRPLPSLESNSSDSLHISGYDPYAGSHQSPYTETEPIISLPDSEKMTNAYQSNNNEMIKKLRRLTSEQLASLEQSFQNDITLDTDKKLKLSKELGLPPRQVAIWFQNRRARYKAKHLEDSYHSLRQKYNIIWKENQMLHDEVKKLRGIILRDQGFMKTQSNLDSNSPTMVASRLGHSGTRSDSDRVFRIFGFSVPLT